MIGGVLMSKWFPLEERQHINISEKTYETLLSDIEKYHLTSLSSLTNLIIENGWSVLPANPVEYVNQQTDIYDKILSRHLSVTESRTIQPDILKDIQQHTIYSFQNKYCKLPKGIQKNIHYSKQSIQLLQHCNDIIIDIYQSPGKFVSALFESYANLKDTERDRIIKKDILNTLNHCIKNNTIACIEMYTNDFYYIMPLTIDTFIGYTYVICKSSPREDGLNGNYIDMSPRISNILSVVNTEKKFEITESEKKAFRKKIQATGAAYFDSPTEDIEVLFTNKGISMYQTILHQRPSYTHKDGNLYTFNCTRRQASNYFFKFGKDALIIQPSELHEQILQNFKDAIAAYS